MTNWDNNYRTLVLFNSNFGPLAGILCAGYYLHTCALPIIRSSRNPEKNIRDIFIGYFLVFISYVICGIMGYVGFMGYEFKNYFISVQNDPKLSG